ncbi:MAG TPA: site-2 protease family protein, partial [Luteolibacter sp.]
RTRMLRFSIFGIPVEVQPFFWVTLVILGGAIGADTATEIFQLVLFVMAGFISILVHELGHALTARSFGAATSITLQAFGGFAAYAGVSMNRWQRFLITAAGPAIQIALGFAVLLLLRNLPELSNHGVYFLHVLMVISFFWAILNLLPVVPLDGGQMLDAALGPERIKITLWVTIVVAITVGAGMFLWDRDPIFPIFLGMFAWQAYQALQQNRWR